MNSLTQLNVKRLAVFLASIALTACVSGTDASDTPSDPTTETFATSLGVNIPQMTKTTLGDYYKDIAIGNGVALFSQTKAHITYNAYLKNGSMFDTGASASISARQRDRRLSRRSDRHERRRRATHRHPVGSWLRPVSGRCDSAQLDAHLRREARLDSVTPVYQARYRGSSRP